MELLSLDEYTRSFFKHERAGLEKNYPGISEERIRREVRQLLSQTQLNPSDTSKAIFFPSATDEVTLFFEELKTGRPIEQIRKRAFFYRSEFYINESVLIPRSETEILVEEVAKYINKNLSGPVSICDIGTGSGAIILSLLQESNYEMKCLATDISNEALKVAKRNLFLQRFKFKKSSHVDFHLGDRLSGIEHKFDIIVTNPPYIKTKKDFATVHHQVAKFEPHLALFIEDEAYSEWFEVLFTQVHECLNEGGLFYMEGHEDHLEDLSQKLLNNGFNNVEIVKDYTNRNRFLKGYKNAKA